jgi:hypothetical protein
MKTIIILISFIFSFSSWAQDRKPSQDINIEGEFIIFHTHGSFYFELIDHSNNEFAIKIAYKGNGQATSCLFHVTSISAPQQTRGRNGNIFANQLYNDGCTYQLENKETERLMNSIKLVNISYHINPSRRIVGSISLQSIESDYHSKFR